LELPTDLGFLLPIFGCAFFSLVGQWFLTKGFQTVKAGIASVMRYFDVVFVMCLDALVLGETVNLYSVLGAAIIISGASVIVMRQAVSKK
jgi:drug/metabolite transporter (DMT)-like permease